MHISRRAEVLVQSAAIAWAGILALAGIWLLASGSTVLPVSRSVTLLAGLALLGAAQFIYMVLFADHLFPHVHPRVRSVGEIGSFAIFVAGLSLAAWFLVRS